MPDQLQPALVSSVVNSYNPSTNSSIWRKERGTLVFVEQVVLNRFNKLSSRWLIYFNRYLDGAFGGFE
jgi:hypothetical protein